MHELNSLRSSAGQGGECHPAHRSAKAFATQLEAVALAAALDDLLSDAYIPDAALTRIATGGRNGRGVNEAAAEGT